MSERDRRIIETDNERERRQKNGRKRMSRRQKGRLFRTVAVAGTAVALVAAAASSDAPYELPHAGTPEAAAGLKDGSLAEIALGTTVRLDGKEERLNGTGEVAQYVTDKGRLGSTLEVQDAIDRELADDYRDDGAGLKVLDRGTVAIVPNLRHLSPEEAHDQPLVLPGGDGGPEK